HGVSINIQESRLPNVMYKMRLLGVSLGEVVVRSNVNPAKAIGRYPELGTLGVGRTADISVLEEQTGVFAFKDSWPAKRLGTKRLECVVTVRAGQILYERSARPTRPADTQIYDILIKHGSLAASPNHAGEVVDLGVTGGKIARIGRHLPAAHARVV